MTEDEFLGQANAQENQDDNQTEEAQLDDNQTDNQEQGEELQLSPIEQKAYDQGWRPEEDFKGDP